jgi:hypothetical protein
MRIVIVVMGCLTLHINWFLFEPFWYLVMLVYIMRRHLYVPSIDKVESVVNKLKKYALPGIGIIPLEVVYSG